MEYNEFLKSKEKTFISSGFEVDLESLNPLLKDFQSYAVQTAISKGRFALFFDCGLGKTFMQLEWARLVSEQTNMPVLILAPLAVSAQTIRESEKFGININVVSVDVENQNEITNYEQLKNIDVSKYSGVVLDESSILKGKDGKLSSLIIESFKNTPYKLACTATPSPNDNMELGQHVEFLGYDTYDNMKSMFFVQDSKIKTSNKWRLKRHSYNDFWKYVSTWSMSCDSPSTLGFDSKGYDLPDIEYIEHKIPVEVDNGTLFGDVAVSATDLHKELKKTLDARIKLATELVNDSDDQWLIWTLSNESAKLLKNVINDSVNVQGSDKPEVKAKNLLGFANKDYKCLITKTEIASYGLNYQQANHMLFFEYDFKFEQFFQAVRREYRFGQTKKVYVHLFTPDTQQNVKKSIELKQANHFKRIKEMSKYSNLNDYKKDVDLLQSDEIEVKEELFWLMHGDSIEKTKKISTESVDYTLFSPPFKDLFTYSSDPRDLSNVGGDKDFFKHFGYLVPELFRTLKKGRLLSMHVMQGTTSIGKDGYYSIVDFRGELIRLFQSHGFIFHAEKMIRKNPQLAAVRTKNHQLMHGTTKRDSSISRCGLADYIITFRKPGKNEVPIKNDIDFDSWCEMAEPYELDNDINIEMMRKIYDPLWLDIDEGDVLSNFRNARGKNDEKHMTPTQLTVLRNCILLYSNVGDTVLSPFGGVGSEGYQSLIMDRLSISIELKKSYFDMNVKNHNAAKMIKSQQTLF